MKILIADDHLLIVEGLKTLLNKHYKNCSIYSATYKTQLFDQLKQHEFNILIQDVRFGNDNAQDFINEIITSHKNLKVIILTSISNSLIINKLLKEKISGFVLKNEVADTIVNAIDLALENKFYVSENVIKPADNSNEGIVLSKREKEVVIEILNEKSINQIAETLHISPKTVEMHRNNLFLKLNVKNITGLVKIVLINNLLEDGLI